MPTDEAEKITWRKDATSWEEYKKLSDILEKLDAYDLELVTIEDDIQSMGDDATPEKVERLREYDERVRKIEYELDEVSAEFQSNNQSKAYKVEPTNPQSVPNLNL